MIDWNNLLKCLAFGALAPTPLLALLAWAGIHPVLILLTGVVLGIISTSYALGEWDPFD